MTNIKHNANRGNLLREAWALTEGRMLNEKGPIKAKPKTAFHLFYNANDLAREYAEKYGLELMIYDWRKDGRILYLRLSEILCKI